MKSLISIIIVHWNTPKILREQLSKLTLNNQSQIIVVDNASEKSVDWIEKEFPKIEVIRNKFNRGYAFACNQGVLKAIGEWLLFLNPDVEIKPETIRQMIDQAKKQNLDACSPMVGEDYQKLFPSWWSLLVEFTPLNKIGHFKNFINFNNFMNSRTLFGGCLLIKREVIEKLGGWDERFFLWFEDSDLTLRLIKNKLRTGWVDVVVKHTGGASFNQLTNQYKKDIFFHSMDVYAKKHFSWWGKIVVDLIKKRYSSRKLLPVSNNIVSITIPNLKRNLLEDFFAKNSSTLGVEEEWIVVTSAINNFEIWEWRGQYPGVRFIPIDKNYGFSHTVNVGVRVSTGTWIGTINDDVFLKENWLKNCLQCVGPNTGSINPVILKKDQSIESAGINILVKGKAVVINYLPHDVVTTDATNAACVLYSKEALNKVGLFDEKFGSYLEDIDLSLRLKKYGYLNIVCKNSAVIHLGQATSKQLGAKKQFLDFRNWIYVIIKNWGVKKIILNFPAIFIERLRNLSGILKTIK